MRHCLFLIGWEEKTKRTLKQMDSPFLYKYINVETLLGYKLYRFVFIPFISAKNELKFNFRTILLV